jgi:polysaccharide biosynthesis protein PslG
MEWGFSPGYDFLNATDRFQQCCAARAAGATWIRVDFQWKDMEASASSGYSWTLHDAVLNDCWAAGLKVLALLGTTPSWARGSSTSDYAPPTSGYASRLGDWVQAVVGRYASLGLTYYELGNEVNLAKSGTGYTNTGSAYATNMLAPMGGAIRYKSGQIGIALHALHGSLSPTWSGSDTDPLTFLQAVYSSGNSWQFDAVAYHPYVGSDDPTTSDNMNAIPAALWTEMVSHGDYGQPIWATEYGIPCDGGNHFDSESSQSTRLTNGMTTWKGKTFAGPMFVYSVKDKQAYNATSDQEDYFGLEKSSGVRKTSYGTVAAVMRAG